MIATPVHGDNEKDRPLVSARGSAALPARLGFHGSS